MGLCTIAGISLFTRAEVNVRNDLPGIVTGADGLIIDSEGRLYALTAAGVEIFSPQGKHLGVIGMSCNDQDCQGLAFSGPKKSTLYVAICRRSWRSLGN